MYAYVWTDGASADVLDTTKVADDIYKVSVPSKYKKIIFKNTSSGWDKQTIDLLIPTDSNNCWKPNGSSNKSSGNWYAYREQNEFSVDVVLYGKKGNVSAKAVVSNGTAHIHYPLWIARTERYVLLLREIPLMIIIIIPCLHILGVIMEQQ